MKLQYRPAAIADIQRSAAYIEHVLKNRPAAQQLKTKLLQTISLLKENPNMGMLLSSKYDGVDSDIRFIVVSHQIVFYEICEDTVVVIRVLDSRTDYMTHLFGEE